MWAYRDRFPMEIEEKDPITAQIRSLESSFDRVGHRYFSSRVVPVFLVESGVALAGREVRAHLLEQPDFLLARFRINFALCWAQSLAASDSG